MQHVTASQSFGLSKLQALGVGLGEGVDAGVSVCVPTPDATVMNATAIVVAITRTAIAESACLLSILPNIMAIFANWRSSYSNCK